MESKPHARNTGVRTARNLQQRALPVQPRGARTLKAVLDAAHRILKANGIDGLTTMAVARESGVAVGTVYRLFPNKEAIVCKVYEDKIRTVHAIGEDIRRTFRRGDDWRVAVGAYIRTLKAAEQSTDFDLSLANAVFLIPEIRRIDAMHAIGVADGFVELLKTLGSTWSDAALFEVAITLYCLESAPWFYAMSFGTPNSTLGERIVTAMLALIEPAMRGDPEPTEGGIDRARLLSSYA